MSNGNFDQGGDGALEMVDEREELHRLRAMVIRLRTTLLASHACATLREGGTCDGCCLVSEALE
jgi:hypothetical protein